MRTSSTIGRLALLILALVCPILYLRALLLYGRALLYFDFTRLSIIYLSLALAAGAATFLVFHRGNFFVRLAAGLALIANLGGIAYAQTIWQPDIERSLAEVEGQRFDETQTGILVAAADHSPIAMDEARNIEEAIASLLAGAGLKNRIVVRPTYPIASEAQAIYTGRNLGASVVLWKTSVPKRDRYQETYHITVLGTNIRDMDIDGVTLLLTGILRDTFSVSTTRREDAPSDAPLIQEVVIPVTTGFALAAENELLLAAGQFEKATHSKNLTPMLQAKLQNYLGALLLLYGRADLASAAFERSNELYPNASAWLGLGCVAASQHQWDAAAEAFARAITLDPYNAAPYCGLGWIQARKRDIYGAYQIYQQALALEPQSPMALAFMGLLYELRADVTAAQQAYHAAALYALPDKGLYNAVMNRAEAIRRNPPTPVPTATPKPAPSPTPIPTSDIYTVQQGDTLKTIADKFGVSISELIEINQIEDPNQLYSGEILLIPPPPD